MAERPHPPIGAAPRLRGRRPTGRRLWRLRAVAVVALAAAAMVVGEVLARAAGIAPVLHRIELDAPWATFESSPNPLLVYVPKPRAGDISSYGIRDYERDLAKRTGVERIVVIGDSFAFGLGIPDLADTFPKRLEQELRIARGGGAGRDVEVLNLAVSGYDTEQQVEFLKEKGLRLEPDRVVVSFCLNDYEDSSWEARRIRADGRHVENERLREALRRNVLFHSHLVRWGAGRVGWLERAADGAGSEPARPRGSGGNRVERGFAELRRLADAHGFHVLVVVWPDLRSFETYPLLERHHETERHARAAGFDVLDLGRSFVEATGGDPSAVRQSDLLHPNEAGHALAARIVAAHLGRAAGAS